MLALGIYPGPFKGCPGLGDPLRSMWGLALVTPYGGCWQWCWHTLWYMLQGMLIMLYIILHNTLIYLYTYVCIPIHGLFVNSLTIYRRLASFGFTPNPSLHTTPTPPARRATGGSFDLSFSSFTHIESLRGLASAFPRPHLFPQGCASHLEY